MTKGELALVLHAHLPYVRSEKPGSLEEDWFFQALMECYLPLLNTLEVAALSQIQKPKLTIGLSPTLLSLLEDEELQQRFPKWIKKRLYLLENIPPTSDQNKPAIHLEELIKKQLKQWEACNGDLISRFASLQNDKVIDILTCAATHGYLPLLRENPEAVNGQLKTATKEHHRLFGEYPLGIWLPECAYYEGLDLLMNKAGLRYAVLDGHGLLHASPRPRYGIYAPICSKNGVAFFGRDSEATLPVWSAKEGYPGNSEYREFHRDLGWDIPLKELEKIGINDQRPLGLKFHKVTSQKATLDKKELYDPKSAKEQIKKDATHYLKGRKAQLEKLEKQMQVKPLLIAPFDAELFGHWWFEGPSFLAELFAQAAKEKIQFTRLKDFLTCNPQLQLCEPCPSSWGQGGYHDYWSNESNSWIIPEWNKAANAFIQRSKLEIKADQLSIKLLKYAARELLLSQSSDWSFILRAGTTTELAKNRISRHLERFWTLIKILNNEKEISDNFIQKIESEDNLFPLIDIGDWDNS